jgi:quercetin dioxygenase-like cupin family protein
MKRFRTLAAVAAALALCGVVATAALAGHARRADPTGVRITPLAHGTIASRANADRAGIAIRTKGPRDLLVTAMTVDPGGSFGWHTHPGPVLVAVSKGTLTVYERRAGRCEQSTVTAGQAFIEDGAHIHLARNEGADPVELNAVFLARVGTKAFLDPVPEPKGCNV